VLALSLAAAFAAPKVSQAQGGAPAQQSPVPSPAPAPAPAPGAGPAGAPTAQGAAPAVKTAAQAFMNVQVLTDIPADQLVPSMQFISASLGVRCNFCHVNPFQNDDKREKKTAREMIKMQLGIDKTSFNGRTEVTCYTCHAGSAHPTSVPVIPEPGATPTMASMMGGPGGGEHQMPMGQGAEGAGGPGGAGANGPGQAQAAYPTVDQILDKWTQAQGGADAIAKFTSIDAKGTVDGEGGTSMAIEVVIEAPNKQWISLQTKNGAITTGYDGTTAWSQDPAGKVRDLEGVQLEAEKRAADLLRLADVRKHYSQLRLTGVGQVGDHHVYVVMGIPAGGGARERLYFDSDSGLLVRYQFVVPTPLGNYPFETDYADYKSVGGLNVPFTVREAQPSESNTAHFTDVQINVKADESKFQKPAPKPGTPPPSPVE
jgi:outer membrane lipoprotein-sorting protein